MNTVCCDAAGTIARRLARGLLRAQRCRMGDDQRGGRLIPEPYRVLDFTGVRSEIGSMLMGISL